MNYNLQDIGRIVSPHSPIDSENVVRVLLTDSRSLSDPAETLFFALVTPYDDGHRYIADLYRRGVRSFVVQHPIPEQSLMTDASFLEVEDTLHALQQVAAYHRSRFDMPVVGITGSNGKTIVKEWLFQLLSNQYVIARSPKSYNSQIGVPLSVWQLNEQTQLGIFEAGISLPGEMEKLEPIIRPTIGVFTMLGEAHQDGFASKKEKCEEKLRLFESVDSLVFCEDQPLLKESIEEKGLQARSFAWSRVNRQASLFIADVKITSDDTYIIYVYGGIESEIRIPFTDEASIENAIHCLAVLLLLGLTVEASRFAQLESIAMRLEVLKGINGNSIINDAYNSDINSLGIALDFMQRRDSEQSRRKVLILSDMPCSHLSTDDLYRRIAMLVDQYHIDYLIGIGPELMARKELFKVEQRFYFTTSDFLESNEWRTIRQALLLIKGSRRFAFESIVEKLVEKAHQTVLSVDLNAVVHNLKYFRSLLRPETKIICMVKAFGYGIGSHELAKTLQERGADYLAVAVADEGAELRREGITMPIMVMNPEEHALNTLFEYQQEPEIYSLSLLNSFIREARRRGITNYPIHLKIDTGMNRLGFSAVDIPELFVALRAQQSVTVRSAFSHLAGSDSAEFDLFTQQQIDSFTRITQELERGLGYSFLRHILNSAGIERFPQAQFNMARLGIGLYGVSAVNNQLLQPVATLKTVILQIRNVGRDETVGYSRKGRLARDSRIAIIPVGYADGLDRHLGNGVGEVLVNGVRCPIVGNICMDITMIDVTDTDAQVGDEVIIFGAEPSISELASRLGTIPYEILTSISPRVKRIYTFE